MKERKKIILQLLKEYTLLTVKELSAYCQVSLNTTRSDLAILQQERCVIKFHGSVMLNNSFTYAVPQEVNIRHNHKIEAKRKIGKLVAEYLSKNKDISLFFDSSTTSLEVAKNLIEHPTRITAITNFSNIAQILSKNANNSVILCGGKWLSYENCTIGDSVLEMIKTYSVDYAIMGCTAINLEHGVYNGSFETVSVKQQMIKNARETWIVCDDEKFDKTDLISMFPVNLISKIFTNKIVPSQWIQYSNTHPLDIYY